MLSVSIKTITSAEVAVSIVEQVTFSSIKLFIVDGSGNVEIDSYENGDEKSFNGSLRISQSTGSIVIDMNMLNFDYVYYKRMFIVFFDQSGVEVDRTVAFAIEPDGASHMLGVVKKLIHDFEVLAKVSGTTLKVIGEPSSKTKCSECWDYDLDQRIKTNCPACSGNRVINDILAKRVKTNSRQSYSDKGKVAIDQVVFQTYARVDMKKGTIILDMPTMEFFEVTDRKIATIGAIRTSTMIIAKNIPGNDSRISEILTSLE